MTSPRSLLLSGLLLLLSTPGLPVVAHVNADGVLGSERKRETLRDLTGVQVIVEPLPDDTERAGLRTERLRNDIEGQLSHAGIRVLSEDERRNQPGFPFLYVGVTTVKSAAIYSYAIDISLNQTVNLTRHPTIATFAPTWTAQATGVVSESRLPAIADHVRDFISRFIEDYRTMNAPDEDKVREVPN